MLETCTDFIEYQYLTSKLFVELHVLLLKIIFKCRIVS